MKKINNSQIDSDNKSKIRLIGWLLSRNFCILGKFDRQSVSTHPWPEFNPSDFSSTSASLRGEQKKGEGERERQKERDRQTERESVCVYVCLFMSKACISRVQIHNSIDIIGDNSKNVNYDKLPRIVIIITFIIRNIINV